MKLPEYGREVAALIERGLTKHWYIAVHDGRAWYTSDGSYLDAESVICWMELPNI